MRGIQLVYLMFIMACSGNSSGPQGDTPNVTASTGGTLVLGDGAVTIVIPAGSASANTYIEAKIADAPPEDPATVRGSTYTVTANPAVSFSKPLKVTLKYDPLNGPIGINEGDYGISVVDGAAWRSNGDNTVDVSTHKVSASVSQLGTFAVQRTPPAASCTQAEHRQFDFWIGEWNVGGVHSTISRDAVGCTIFELYRAPKTGRSISTYNPETGTWYQTYISSGSAAPLLMSGRFENGKMIMYVRLANGKLSQRWTWEKVDANTVTQKSEGTSDDGATWTPAFSGTYIRRP